MWRQRLILCLSQSLSTCILMGLSLNLELSISARLVSKLRICLSLCLHLYEINRYNLGGKKENIIRGQHKRHSSGEPGTHNKTCFQKHPDMISTLFSISQPRNSCHQKFGLCKFMRGHLWTRALGGQTSPRVPFLRHCPPCSGDLRLVYLPKLVAREPEESFQL